MNMAEKISKTSLERSYGRLRETLPEGVLPGFSVNDYDGKHREGKWIHYPFVCKACGHQFKRTLNRVKSIACPSCTTFTRPGRQVSWEKWLEKFHKNHGDKYIYPKEPPKDFRSARHIITIECLVHGSFEQKVSRHAKGYGCRKCAIDSRRVGGPPPPPPASVICY